MVNAQCTPGNATKRELLERIFTGQPTRDSMDRFKALSEDARLARLRDVAHFEVLGGEHPFSLLSLEAKVSFLREANASLSRYGIRVLPSVSAVMKTDETFELMRKLEGYYLYQYSAATRMDHSNQDAVLSAFRSTSRGRHSLQIHAIFDGVSGCVDGRMASHLAAGMLLDAFKIGAVLNITDVIQVLAGINIELHKKDITTTASVVVINHDSMALVQMGDSPAMLADAKGDTILFKSRNRFLGMEPHMVFPSPIELSFKPGQTMFLETDGFASLTIEVTRQLLARYINDIISSQPGQPPQFLGFGPWIRPPRGPEPGSGPPDDASLILVHRSP